MEPYDAYKLYLAMKLHFTSAKYNIVEQKGRVTTTREAFASRKDNFIFAGLSRKYNEKQFVNLLLANFITGDQNGGLYERQLQQERYVEWTARQEKLTYLFSQDIQNLYSKSATPLISINGQHPIAVKMYLGKKISLETLVILDKLQGCAIMNDTELKNDIIWNDLKSLIKKYRPFLKVNREKFKQVLENNSTMEAKK